ncbi:MAG TPA: AMP-binding protein [Ornithinibacter sp.]|nr:AMP-binding protein [Ornithinibacter sp.]
MIHTSPMPDVEIPRVALTGYVLERAAELGDQPALIDGPTGRTITYAGLDAAVRSLAGGLVSQGFAPGDVVALMSPNVPEYAVIFHGVAFAGGAVTTINPTYTEREVHNQLVDSGARMLVTIPMFLDVARAGAVGTAVEEVYVLGDSDDAPSVMTLFGAPLAEQVPVDPDDVVVLPYSSGTTGTNKGVMLTHHNLVANIAQTLAAAEIGEGDTFVAVLPFFHIYGMQVLMNTGLRAGVTVITMPRFDLELFLRLHADHHVTRAFVAPPIIVALAKHPMVDAFDLSSLTQVFSAAAPLSADLALEAGARLGCEVAQGYGMTELSPVSHVTPPGQFKPGTVGVTVPNTELRIVDPATGIDLPDGEDGEVWIRGPQVMKGYLNNPVATDGMIDPDGWLHTGDIGHVDADEHLSIVDRLKELIKSSGFQVAPAELEGLLLTHPAVADAAVIGRPDDARGEVPVAYVVLRPGAEATAADLEEYVDGQVAHFKKLGGLIFIDEIPKSASGKILRRVLKDSEPTG